MSLCTGFEKSHSSSVFETNQPSNSKPSLTPLFCFGIISPALTRREFFSSSFLITTLYTGVSSPFFA
jgi:hypothetical protein